MNKHGQALITFVLMLPLIILFMAFLVNSSLIIMEKAKLDGVIKSNLDILAKEDNISFTKLEQIVKKNDNNINLIINIKDNIVNIEASKKNKNLFANIIKMKWYDLKVNYCINLENREIKKNCEVG